MKEKIKLSKENLDILANYLSIIHQTSGRIRLRINPKIKNIINEKNYNLKDIFKDFEKSNIFKNIKINKLIASITIEYDNKKLDDKIWDMWINQKDSNIIYDKLITLLEHKNDE